MVNSSSQSCYFFIRKYRCWSPVPFFLAVVALLGHIGITDSFQIIHTSSSMIRRTLDIRQSFHYLWRTTTRELTTTSPFLLFEAAPRGRLLLLSSSSNNAHQSKYYTRERIRLFSTVSNPKPQSSNTDEDEHDQDTVTTNDEKLSFLARSVSGDAVNDNLVVARDNVRTELMNGEMKEDLLEGLKIRPLSEDNRDREDPLGWAKDFGRRSPETEEYLKPLIRLRPGDEEYFEVDENEKVPGVTIVRNKEQADVVLEKLKQADASVFHACDTEVMAIDLKEVGPVGNGYVTCVSIYSGPDFDYGLGDGPGTVLWIDNLDDSCGLLQKFKEWFEDEKHQKVWHNYGFDRHVMWNEGIDVRGFGGDTMHMARLQDTSRIRSGNGNGYSLEALTAELLDDKEMSKKSMKELFGVPRIRKDGSEGSLIDVPPVEVMQRDPQHRRKWIEYSCKDAKGTWEIREVLQKKLEEKHWYEEKNLYEYYRMHMRPFGEVLTDMERRGIRVDARDYLAKVETQARKDRDYHCEQFRKWAQTLIGADGLALNPASSVQLQTFLFGGAPNQRTGEYTEKKRVFKVPREEIPEAALEAYSQQEKGKKPGTASIIIVIRLLKRLISILHFFLF